jgi:cupin superfamily acireductone dioxygenase involved in methionine salvage
MDKRKRTTDCTTVQPPVAKPALTQAPALQTLMQDTLKHIQEIAEYVAAINRLSVTVSTETYDCVEATEEQRKQLEILAEVQEEHVHYLEEATKKAFGLLSAAPAAGGVR